MTNQDVTALAEGFFDAYNSGDLDRLGAAIADDIEFTHHNRGAHAKGRENMMAVFSGAAQVMPDKHFENRTSLEGTGPDSVVVRHTWVANPTVDLPGVGQAGEEIRLDLASFLRFRDGLLVEYNDYG